MYSELDQSAGNNSLTCPVGYVIARRRVARNEEHVTETDLFLLQAWLYNKTDLSSVMTILLVTSEQKKTEKGNLIV